MGDIENVIIIGSGPAGLSAALYMAREDFKPVVVSGSGAGGQLLLTTTVENYPGFPDGVLGSEIVDLMHKQAEKFGARFVSGDVTDIDLSSRPFKIKVGDQQYESKTVIIATGASARWLGIESEKRFIGRGVSSCATCDGTFAKGKDVIVVGGGDTAMEDSNFLTRFANSVTIVHRRDQFRASKIMQNKVLSNPKIKVLYNTVVEEILGDAKVGGVKLRNVATNELTEMDVQFVFVAVGYTPNTSFLKGKLGLDEQGYIVAEDEVRTKIEGCFVAGDVSDRRYRQAVTAAAAGVKAALEVREYFQRTE